MTCSTPDCNRPATYKGRRLCRTCYRRAWRAGTLTPVPRDAHNRHGPDTLANLRELDEAHVGANEAAERVGFPTAEALEKWLYRKGQGPLWLRFKHRDPFGTHSGQQRAARRHESEAS